MRLCVFGVRRKMNLYRLIFKYKVYYYIMEFVGYFNLNNVIKVSIFNIIFKLNFCVIKVLMLYDRINNGYIMINKLMRNVYC